MPRRGLSGQRSGGAHHVSVEFEQPVPMSEVADLALTKGWEQTRIAIKRELAEHEHASANFDVINSTWDGKFAVRLAPRPWP